MRERSPRSPARSACIHYKAVHIILYLYRRRPRGAGGTPSGPSAPPTRRGLYVASRARCRADPSCHKAVARAEHTVCCAHRDRRVSCTAAARPPPPPAPPSPHRVPPLPRQPRHLRRQGRRRPLRPSSLRLRRRRPRLRRQRSRWRRCPSLHRPARAYLAAPRRLAPPPCRWSPAIYLSSLSFRR